MDLAGVRIDGRGRKSVNWALMFSGSGIFGMACGAVGK